MKVREFKEFCRNTDIVLRDDNNGRQYTKIDNYLDKEVTGFYTRFNVDDYCAYAPWCGIQVVAWTQHDFGDET